MTVKPKKCFVALFDILGFSDLVKTGQLQSVYRTYRETVRTFRSWQKIIFKEKTGFPMVKSEVFSDTFLLYVETCTDDGFSAILGMCNALIFSAVENGLMIRGAVTAGELIISRGAVIGKPIVEAYEHEQRQEWMGCWLTAGCIREVSEEKLNGLVTEGLILDYNIPLKSEDVKSYYALNWVRFMTIIYQFVYEGNPHAEERLKRTTQFLDDLPSKWDARRKALNTQQFRDYALKTSVSKNNPSSVRTSK
jgi:hypothetical protein